MIRPVLACRAPLHFPTTPDDFVTGRPQPFRAACHSRHVAPGRDFAPAFVFRADVIYFRCQTCAGVVRANDDEAGQRVACPRCAHTQDCPVRDLPDPAALPPGARPSTLRVFVGVVALLALGAGAWTAVRVGNGGRAEAAFLTTSNTEAQQRGILEANVGLPGDADLLRQYATLNAAHFGGRLPVMPVRWEPRLAEVGRAAGQAFTLEGMFGHVNGRAAILMHPDLQRDAAALTRTLSHEMVHVQLWTTGEAGEKHGPTFQRELARLSLEGAFTGIVASPAERENLRVWIEGERGRLDMLLESERRDQADLDRDRAALEATIGAAQERNAERAELEGLESRRESYNRRVSDASARAEQRAADAAELNRQIDRYNLMLSYPDGLDHGEPASSSSR